MDASQTYRFPFASYPAARIALLFGSGIIVGHHYAIPTTIWLPLLLSLLAALLVLEQYKKRRLSTNQGFHYLGILLYLASIVVFGAGWYKLHLMMAERESPGLPDTFDWEQLDISGEINRIGKTAKGKLLLDIEVTSTVLQDSVEWGGTYMLRGMLNPEEVPLSNRLRLGDNISVSAIPYPLHDKRNPHEFGYKEWLATLGIHNQAGIDTVLSITKSSYRFSWNAIRQTALDMIDQNFGEQAAPLAKALLIGYKNELDREEKLAFSRVGLSHIMAVSGLHVGFLLAPFWMIVPWFWTFRYGRQAGLILLLLLLFFYAGLTGFSASVSRASITGGFIMYGRLFNKVRDSKNLTALAALLILLMNPGELFGIGFQLSFSAVYIILLTAPILNRSLPVRIRFRWYGQPLTIVLVSVIVQIGLFPLLSYYFGEFSLIGPLANALFVPLLTIVVPFALFLLPVSALSQAAAFFLNRLNVYALNFLDYFVTLTSQWDGSWIQIQTENPLLFLVWACAILLAASLHIARLRWKLTAGLLVLCCLNLTTDIYQKLSRPEMKITVFDVGQGDATLVQSPAGKYFLIDTGTWSPDYNSGRSVILPHLKAEGIDKLDAVFLSHPHADHIGGIVDLIRETGIDTIYNSGFQYDSRLYATYLKEAAQKGIPVKPLGEGMSINIDPSMRIFVLGPAPGMRSTDPNQHSLILELIYGDTEFLFLGDAGKEQEDRLLKAFGSFVETDLLKVGHHGSRTSSSPELLTRAKARIAVVSLDITNRFGHPHPEAIRRIRQSGSELLFTSLEGALVFTSDGKRIQKSNWSQF